MLKDILYSFYSTSVSISNTFYAIGTSAYAAAYVFALILYVCTWRLLMRSLCKIWERIPNGPAEREVTSNSNHVPAELAPALDTSSDSYLSLPSSLPSTPPLVDSEGFPSPAIDLPAELPKLSAAHRNKVRPCDLVINDCVGVTSMIASSTPDTLSHEEIRDDTETSFSAVGTISSDEVPTVTAYEVNTQAVEIHVEPEASPAEQGTLPPADSDASSIPLMSASLDEVLPNAAVAAAVGDSAQALEIHVEREPPPRIPTIPTPPQTTKHTSLTVFPPFISILEPKASLNAGIEEMDSMLAAKRERTPSDGLARNSAETSRLPLAGRTPATQVPFLFDPRVMAFNPKSRPMASAENESVTPKDGQGVDGALPVINQPSMSFATQTRPPIVICPASDPHCTPTVNVAFTPDVLLQTKKVEPDVQGTSPSAAPASTSFAPQAQPANGTSPVPFVSGAAHTPISISPALSATDPAVSSVQPQPPISTRNRVMCGVNPNLATTPNLHSPGLASNAATFAGSNEPSSWSILAAAVTSAPPASVRSYPAPIARPTSNPRTVFNAKTTSVPARAAPPTILNPLAPPFPIVRSHPHLPSPSSAEIHEVHRISHIQLAAVQEEVRKREIAHAALVVDLEAKLEVVRRELKAHTVRTREHEEAAERAASAQLTALRREKGQLEGMIVRIRSERETARLEVLKVRDEGHKREGTLSRQVALLRKQTHDRDIEQKTKIKAFEAQLLTWRTEVTNSRLWVQRREAEVRRETSEQLAVLRKESEELERVHAEEVQKLEAELLRACKEVGKYRLQAERREDDVRDAARLILRREGRALDRAHAADQEVARLEGELHRASEKLDKCNVQVQERDAALAAKDKEYSQYLAERSNFQEIDECYRALKEEHARLQQHLSRMEAVHTTRVDRLELEHAALRSQSTAHITTEQVLTEREREHLRKEAEFNILIARAERLYKAGLSTMRRKIKDLTHERDVLRAALK